MESSEYSRTEGTNKEEKVEFKPIIQKIYTPNIELTSFDSILNQVIKKVEKYETLECTLLREKRGLMFSYVYRLFGEEKEPFLVANTESTLFSTQFSVLEPYTGKRIGKIESDSKSLIYNVTGPDLHFKIIYDENFLGRHGFRTFKVIIPKGKDEREYILKQPVFINGEYYQDFTDLDTIPSIKNFICVKKRNPNKTVCVFVRNSDDKFILRVSKPFSLYIAFCIALTSLHTGIFHR